MLQYSRQAFDLLLYVESLIPGLLNGMIDMVRTVHVAEPGIVQMLIEKAVNVGHTIAFSVLIVLLLFLSVSFGWVMFRIGYCGTLLLLCPGSVCFVLRRSFVIFVLAEKWLRSIAQGWMLLARSWWILW